VSAKLQWGNWPGEQVPPPPLPPLAGRCAAPGKCRGQPQ